MSSFSRPATLLRLEGLATMVVATYLYSIASGDWVLFGLLLLVPDVSILGYARGTFVGSVTYNLFHTEILPLAISAAAIYLGQPLALGVGLVWLAHIGMDRMAGYGLKLATSFRETHLGRIGRDPKPWRPEHDLR